MTFGRHTLEMSVAKTPAYAIVRIDGVIQPVGELVDRVTVVKVVLTQSVAEAEAGRLNLLNADKDCTYFWQTTRLVQSNSSDSEL